MAVQPVSAMTLSATRCSIRRPSPGMASPPKRASGPQVGLCQARDHVAALDALSDVVVAGGGVEPELGEAESDPGVDVLVHPGDVADVVHVGELGVAHAELPRLVQAPPEEDTHRDGVAVEFLFLDPAPDLEPEPLAAPVFHGPVLGRVVRVALERAGGQVEHDAPVSGPVVLVESAEEEVEGVRDAVWPPDWSIIVGVAGDLVEVFASFGVPRVGQPTQDVP